MTQAEFERILYQAVNDAYYLLQGVAPVRTGELKRSIKLIATDKGYQFQITAPHTVYTNEAWVHERWRGRKNPNEAWIQEATDLIFRLLRAKLKTSGRMIGG